jgi:hypothetical protein
VAVASEKGANVPIGEPAITTGNAVQPLWPLPMTEVLPSVETGPDVALRGANLGPHEAVEA